MRGGQGRSEEELMEAAWTAALCFAGMAVLFLIAAIWNVL